MIFVCNHCSLLLAEVQLINKKCPECGRSVTNKPIYVSHPSHVYDIELYDAKCRYCGYMLDSKGLLTTVCPFCKKKTLDYIGYEHEQEIQV